MNPLIYFLNISDKRNASIQDHLQKLQMLAVLQPLESYTEYGAYLLYLLVVVSLQSHLQLYYLQRKFEYEWRDVPPQASQYLKCGEHAALFLQRQTRSEPTP